MSCTRPIKVGDRFRIVQGFDSYHVGDEIEVLRQVTSRRYFTRRLSDNFGETLNIFHGNIVPTAYTGANFFERAS